MTGGLLEIDVTQENDLATSLSGLRGQLPFAYAVGINDTVNQVQTAIQIAVQSEFTLRRAAFIENTIYRKPGQDFATKSNLSGSVRVNPDRDFLAKFEDGGTKVGQHSLAIPIMRLDGDPNLIIGAGDPLSVKRLMASIQIGGGRVVRPRFSKKKGTLTVKEDPNKVFLVKSTKGTFIIQRTGDGKGDTRVLYAFRKSVPIKAELHFEEIGMRTALERFDPNFSRAIQVAIDTMR